MSSGPQTDTAAGEVVIVNVSADGPYGANFVPDSEGFAAVIQSFDRLPNGKFGPLQKHGGLHAGDVLFEINDTPLSSMPFAETMKIVMDRNLLKKAFKFVNSKEYNRRKKATSVVRSPAQDKNNLLCTVKRSRLTEEGGRKYGEFEVACRLVAVSTKVQKEVVYQWSVWKRYSEFEALNTQLKKSLGWQMNGIEFPSSYTFAMNKLSPEFLETRRAELSEYWIKVLRIDMITDFFKHHCSQELKDFLDVENNTKKSVAQTADMVDDSSSSQEKSPPAGPTRRGSVKSMRRKQNSTNAGFNYDDETPAVPQITYVAESKEPASKPAAAAAAPAAPAAPRTETAPPPPSGPKPAAPPAPAPPAARPAAPPAPAAAPAAPPTKPAAPAPAAAAAPEGPPSGTTLPPKPTGGRANLLASISARRID